MKRPAAKRKTGNRKNGAGNTFMKGA